MSTFPQETRDLMRASGGGGTRNFLPKIFNEVTELTKRLCEKQTWIQRTTTRCSSLVGSETF